MYNIGVGSGFLVLLVRLVRLVRLVSTLTISHRKRKKERTVDALALGGDEGRGKLR